MSRNLIDRDVLLEKAKQEQRFYKDEYDAMESGYLDEEREIVKGQYSTMTDCVSLINNAPTIDAVEVKHGRWLRTDAFPHRVYCSVCCKTYVTNEEVIQGRSWDCPIYAYEAEYCPHCGAKMDGEVKSDETN